MNRLVGKVAFITGAARSQGRSHAVRLAEEGADIIAVDICDQVDTVGYPMSTPADLEETVAAVTAVGRGIVAAVGDVRDLPVLEALIDDGLTELGRVDIVVANAGIANVACLSDVSSAVWQDMIGINLTGVWHTVKAAVPAILETSDAGSIVLIASYAGANGQGYIAPYSAAKHGVVGLMRSLANELGPRNIRVNTINPGNVGTQMILNENFYRLFRPDLSRPGRADAEAALMSFQTMPIPYVEAVDISNAVVFLASDEARFITGVQLAVDAGWSAALR